MKLYLLQKSELILGTVFFICSLSYLDFYLQSGILGGGTIQFVLFSFPPAQKPRQESLNLSKIV